MVQPKNCENHKNHLNVNLYLFSKMDATHIQYKLLHTLVIFSLSTVLYLCLYVSIYKSNNIYFLDYYNWWFVSGLHIVWHTYTSGFLSIQFFLQSKERVNESTDQYWLCVCVNKVKEYTFVDTLFMEQSWLFCKTHIVYVNDSVVWGNKCNLIQHMVTLNSLLINLDYLNGRKIKCNLFLWKFKPILLFSVK